MFLICVTLTMVKQPQQENISTFSGKSIRKPMPGATNEMLHQIWVVQLKSQVNQQRKKEEAAIIAGARQIWHKLYPFEEKKMVRRIFLFFLARYFKFQCHHLQYSYFTHDKIHIKLLCSITCHKLKPDYMLRKMYTDKDLGLGRPES